MHTSLRPTLLRGVSLTALLMATSPAHAGGGGYKSLSQALASHPSAAVSAAATAGGAAAAQQAGLGAQNFAAAAQRFRSLSDALSGNTYILAPVANGVAPGGLQQADGVAGSNTSTLWSGASTNLTQSVANGTTTVTVDQTGSVAALTWKSFNVGAHTKLVFDQSAGGTLASSWVAINSVQNPDDTPSTILGDISAPGKVYILNPNGILFGAGSQVNVGSLIATTADIAQAQFTTSTAGLITGFSLYGSTTGTTVTSSFLPTFDAAPNNAAVDVAPGAVISTPVPSGTSGGGYVMLLAASVQNAGIIGTPQGQTVLAAGNNFILQPGYSTTNPTATVIGSQVAVTNTGSITGTGIAALGSATNSGIVIADQGDVTMVGHLVIQEGVLLATTTVDNRGTVHLLTDNSDSTAAVVLAPGGVTEVLPEDLYSLNGTLVTTLENPNAAQGILQTEQDAQRTANVALSATDNALRAGPATGPHLNDFDDLADTLGESRIEISTGGTVDMQGGALALAQGGQVAVNAGRDIVLQSGATIDVSGTKAMLAASANDLSVNIQPYEVRDSGANRAGPLSSTNVYVDMNTLVEISTGAYAGNVYTQGGLLEVSGYLGLVPHGINEFTAIGGQVTLQSNSVTNGVTSGGTVVVSAGATINLTGGTVTYGAGMVQQSYVQATDGRVYNINQAPGDLVYSGIYTGVQETHARWNITENFVNPLLTPTETYEPAYTFGRDAGNLTVSAATALLDGTVAAGVTTGAMQGTARPATVSDPFLLAQSVVPLAGSLAVGAYSGGQLLSPQFDSQVLIAGAGGSNQGTPTLPLPQEAVTGTVALNTDMLNDAGFSSILVLTAGDLAVNGSLTLADGGSVTLGGGTVELGAGITAHAGQVNLTNLLTITSTTTAGTVSTTATTVTALSTGAGGIMLAPGVAIDTSGEWTNLQTDPVNHLLAGDANGGAIDLISVGGVDLAAGSVLNVSSGGVLSAAGKLTAAAGGNVAISADILPGTATTYNAAGNVTLAGMIDGLASGAGGTLSIAVPQIVLGTLAGGVPDGTFAVNPGAVLDLPDNSLFAGGFADYVLNGYYGVEVTSGHAVTVTRPVYILQNPTVATGAAAAGAYATYLAPWFTPDGENDTIVQRPGASLALEASIAPTLPDGDGGPVYIDAGAQVTVDPRQSITVAGYGQVTDLGTLTAHGGTITVANTRYDQLVAGSNGTGVQSNYQPGLSVWIGAGALVDASGQAVTFTDPQGRLFGQSGAGGTILLGGLGGLADDSLESTYAQVIERPGAVLDAAGAAASVDVVPALGAGGSMRFATPVTLAGNGGTILARSYSGIAFDGTLRAAGAGAGAAGGTLTMRIDPLSVSELTGLPAGFDDGGRILISTQQIGVQTNPGLVAGETTKQATDRLARISQAQLTQGGFDTLNLFAQDYIAFDGSVALSLARAVTLETPILGSAKQRAADSITAPYISIIGSNTKDFQGVTSGGTLAVLGGADTTLSLHAAMIDFAGELVLGGQQVVTGGAAAPAFSSYGFASTDFDSSGDLRFDLSPDGSQTVLDSAGNITLQAAQLYPATGASATIYAGDNQHLASSDTTTNEFAGGTLTVLGQPGAAPAAPYSVGGTLALVSDVVRQDGIVRAPEGVILLGASAGDESNPLHNGDSAQITDLVQLGPDSIISVSLHGQTIPYGGTVDGVNYSYDGEPVGTFDPVIAIGTAKFDAQAGSVIDLRGGGTLAGGGFIPGRGGSADVNQTPLLNSGTGTVAANTSDPVFAIVAGYGARTAPVAPGDAGYDTPGVGEQIIIGAGEVAGLAAGTYTLLPAYYDLLPGGYRVELTGAAVAPGTTQPFGNFTTLAAVQVGYANTSIAGSVPEAALVTPGAGVRQLSQYDDETYNDFEAASATSFGAARPDLPQDAKTLQVLLNSPSKNGLIATPISIDGASLLKTPATFSDDGATEMGYGATMEVTADAPLEVLGVGDNVVPMFVSGSTMKLPVIGISGAALDDMTAPVEVAIGTVTADIGTRLVLGGTLSSSQGTITVGGDLAGTEAPVVLLGEHADITAADVILTASSNGGTVLLDPGATISTVGQGVNVYGSATALLFSTDYGASGSSPALAVSNNTLQFVPNTDPASAALINIGQGATLATAAGGSMNFVAPSGTNVEVAPANLDASTVNIQVADINIGSAAALAAFAGVLPGGLTLTDASLSTLAQNATVLSLTASQAVNLLGNVTLNSGTTDLVLSTPAIYGYGIGASGSAAALSQDGIVSIVAPVFTWSGVATSDALQTNNTTTVSAVPGGRLAATVAADGGIASLTEAASLTVQAGTIVLGYGPNTQVNDQVTLDRVAVGFDAVTLAASGEITANNQSALAVYATQGTIGAAGAGGNLTLQTPLLTAASGSVLQLSTGGALQVSSFGALAPSATSDVATLGAEIDLAAPVVTVSTAIVLPSGVLGITADAPGAAASIDLDAGADIDLSGRKTPIFDQTAASAGGTLLLDSTGNINEHTGAVINVSAPAAAAGAIALSALDGTVTIDGGLDGQSPAQGGSFTLLAGTLAANYATATGSAFDTVNQRLNYGGFYGWRDFELTTGNILVDQTIRAQTVDLAADSGNLEVSGTINASGNSPGSIALAAGGVLTLDASAVLDAHAGKTADDSYGEPIDADNRAHVTLTSSGTSPGGSIVLTPGATIYLEYPGAAADPQGELVLNAPRLAAAGNLIDVAVSAPGSLDIVGAAEINLFAFRTYSPTDANGTIVQDSSAANAAGSPPIPAGALGIVQIGQDSTAYMAQVDADGATLAGGQLAGLAAYGSKFNLAPGVQIVSTSASGGNLTISGDLDFSGLRTSDPSQFGAAITAVAGSGEAGSIIFRASNDLTVNGSVSDGFLPPPDAGLTPVLKADTTGWEIYDSPANFTPWVDPTNSDLLLPSSAYGVYKAGGTSGISSEIVLLGASDPSGAATEFDVTRPISLNYAISIETADLKAGVVIPFKLVIADDVATGAIAPVPAGGWIATSSISRDGVVLFQKGALIPAGFQFEPGDVFAAGAVLPVTVGTANGQVIPAGTSFDIFATDSGSQITLANDTAPLPVNALIPSNTEAYFGVEYNNKQDQATIADINTLYLRPTGTDGVQGYLYPLAQMLPAGSQSWSMGFVAGANLAAASGTAVLPVSSLQGSAMTPQNEAIDQAPGSLLIDDEHFYSYSASDNANFGFGDVVTAFSVIRTGTGNLSLVAGGNADVSSLYGIYTAGTQDPLGNGADAQFDSARQDLGRPGDLLPLSGAAGAEVNTLISSTYQAYYPNDGGDVLVAAQGDMTSDIFAGDANPGGIGASPSDAVGNWLWRQGDMAGSTTGGMPTAWWINFGTLVDPLTSGGTTNPNAAVQLAMTGFTGIGALGGGNVTVTIGGDAGEISDRDEGGLGLAGASAYNGEGLVIAVGGTGRVLPGSDTPVTTGGGNITLTVGGTLNPLDAAAYDVGDSAGLNGANENSEPQAVDGDLIDIRGNVNVTAGAIGRIDDVYNSPSENLYDPRAIDPAVPDDGVPNGGIVLVPGDGTITLDTDRDLVVGGAGDPGREAEQSLPADGTSNTGTVTPGTGDFTGFTLWRSSTVISLFSSGGNVTPTSLPNQTLAISGAVGNDLPTEARSEYPPTLLVTAATGDIIYGQDDTNPSPQNANVANDVFPYLDYALETMPSATGQVQFLAGKSIFANGYVIDMSGADPVGLSTPADPAVQTIDANGNFGTPTNVLTGPETGLSALSLFALEPDTPTTDLHAADPMPARFYAADGDIVNFQTGQTLNYVLNGSLEATWYLVAKPVWIIASDDIVSTGTRPGVYPSDDPALFDLLENQGLAPTQIGNVYASGNLFLNNTATDVSVISAGRDILSAYAYVIGPGLLEVDAGRNIDQQAYALQAGGTSTQELSFGTFKSLGDDYLAGATPALTGGAGIAVLAGIGAAGPDYTAFADLYFNPANQANLALPITAAANQGKVQQVYTPQLVAWLQANYGYTGSAAGALAYFLASVPAVDQAVFVRTVFFDELVASGAQESDPSSRFYRDYIRGQTAIDILFPNIGAGGALGVPGGYDGAITAYSGPISLLNNGATQSYTLDGGIATLFGGTVDVLDPGGAIEFGIPGGPAPGNNSGIITYGAGDIDIYALDSVLLGKSRIFATGGGNIAIWSSSGDINAGIGAKTTVSYNPPVLEYDDVGDVTETPPASTSGAGIATLQPLPSVPPGDVSLIAPAGSIDAGEAGVRVAGNLVLAGQRVIGANNIVVKGTTQGAPTVNVASLGAVEAAGAAAGAATAAAQGQANGNTQLRDVASVLDVDVVSIGGSYDDERKKRRQQAQQ